MKRALSLWGPVLLWMGAIFYASSIPKLTSGLEWDLLLRKAAHVIEYAILAILLCRAFEGRRDGAALGLAVLYAASDEYHQSFVPGRGASPVDVLIDAAGCAVGVFLYKWRIGRIILTAGEK